MKKKTKSVVIIDHSVWIALVEALNATPDISPDDLVTKAHRLVESRKQCAREVHELEQKTTEEVSRFRQVTIRAHARLPATNRIDGKRNNYE